MITGLGVAMFFALFLLAVFGAMLADAMWGTWAGGITFKEWMKACGIILLSGVGVLGCLILFSYIGKLFT